MLDSNKRIAKNVVALYIRMAFTMIVSFLTVRVTLQVLGSEDYGLNNLVGSVVSLLTFINGSMGTAVQRFYSYEIGKGNENQLSRVFGVGMFLHICVALITFLAGEIFALFFLSSLNIPVERMTAAHVVFQISLISLIVDILSVPYAAMLRAKEDFDKFAILDVVQAIFRLIILYLLFIIAYDKLVTLSVLNLIVTILYVIGILSLASKYPATRFKIVKDMKLVKEMTNFISMLLFTVLFSILRDKGIVILLNLFFGLYVNAAYGVASQVMNMVNTFAMNFKQALVPQIMASYSAGDKLRMEQLIFTGTKITFVLMLLITTPIICEANFILDIFLADVPPKTSEFTILVLVNVNISSFTYFLYQGVHGTGNVKGQQICISLCYFINIVFIYIFFKLGFGHYYALYITICFSIIQCFINIYYAYVTFRLPVRRFFSLVILRSVIVVIMSYGTIYFLKPLFHESTLERISFVSFVELIIVIFSYYIYLDMRERTSVDFMIKKIRDRFFLINKCK